MKIHIKFIIYILVTWLVVFLYMDNVKLSKVVYNLESLIEDGQKFCIVTDNRGNRIGVFEIYK